MTLTVVFFFFLLPLVFLFFTYKIVASVSDVVKYISLALLGLIYAVTVYKFVTSECVDAETDDGLIQSHCIDILGKYLGATLGTLFGLFLVIRAFAKCKFPKEPNQTPSAHDCRESGIRGNASVLNIPEFPISVPQTQVKTVPNAGSTTEDLPPSYWSVISAGEVEETNQPTTDS